MSAEGFEILLDQPALESSGASSGVIDRVNDLFQQILERASALLKDNLPPWPVVETAVRAAYDLYIRPLSIPNFIDNILCNSLVHEVKKVYDRLA